jgi:aminoglycoside/choline kinase family phosphotransferase
MSQLNILDQLKNEIYLIAGDASPRRFYRFKKNKNKILVYCTKDKKNNLENYIKVNNFLIKNKFKAPRVLEQNIKKNYILIEDFGDQSLKKITKNNKKKISLLKKSIDELVRLQKIKVKNQFPNYSLNLLRKELNLFYDWYLPEFFSKQKSDQIKDQINNILIKKINKTNSVKKVFVHRDFHIENLMLIKNKIGFIDNQDAVIGHPVYDVASLIDDVRTRLSKKDQKNLIKYYIKKSSYKGKNLISDLHVLSIQRLLKILGIFLRLYRRDNKKKYLKFLDRTWNLIDLRLAHNDLQDLQVIFNKYFNKKIKNKKWK